MPLIKAQVPDVHFYIVGQKPPPRLRPLAEDPAVTLTGYVDDVRPYIAGAEVYVEDVTYRVLECQQMTGEFDQITLPDPTAFLGFAWQTDETGAEVSVSVLSFESAATTPVEVGIARALDTAAPDATSDMSHVIGSFQCASVEQVPQAFASLSPGIYDALTRTTAPRSMRNVIRWPPRSSSRSTSTAK